VHYSLHTLGGLLLTGPSGETFAESRRKPLALLALLAVAGTRGITRDKAAAYLWADGEPERVRGVLKQTLYSLKRDLNQPELFLGSADLRLNPDVIDTDIAAFERAVADHASTAAAEIYQGPFLDGFHLADAPAFDRWIDEQRDRLARKFAAEIERLALTAIGQSDPRAAADWWLRLIDQDPLDARAVSGLVHACLAAGDRPRAIRYAERHMSMLRQELEITPDPEIRRLVEQARSRPAGHLDSH
jgi:DNA-binding SARP family transcriptional activator